MNAVRKMLCGTLMVAIAVLIATPAGATTLVRASLGDLTATNGTILIGEVVNARSYWNQEHTFILTDVQVEPIEVLKGKAVASRVTVTLMGGTVGDLTTLIIGGAELVPGRSYVLFLDRDDLPGAKGATTLRDHSQGAFEVVSTDKGLRAISQAAGHPLVPDVFGESESAGGPEGFRLEEMVQTIRRLVERPRVPGQEVK